MFKVFNYLGIGMLNSSRYNTSIFYEGCGNKPINIGIITIGILSVLFISDIISTIIGINRTNRYLKLLSKSGSQLRKISESIGENISDKTIQFTQKSENIKNDVKEKRQKAINDMEKHRAAIQRKQEDILKNMPYDCKTYTFCISRLKII